MPCALYRNGFWLPACIAKVIGLFSHRVSLMQRLAFEGLEPCEVKISRRVLRGLGASDGPRLPGIQDSLSSERNYTIYSVRELIRISSVLYY